MHLAVDHARQDVEPPAIEPAARRCLLKIADLHDAAIANADVSLALPVMIDDRAACQDEVVGCRHDASPLLSLRRLGLT